QTFLHDRDLITLEIQRHESTLGGIGEPVKLRKILMYGMHQELFDVSSVETVLIQICPQIRKSRLFLQISHDLGHRIHLSDLLVLGLSYKLALHGSDLGGQTAVGQQASHMLIPSL